MFVWMVVFYDTLTMVLLALPPTGDPEGTIAIVRRIEKQSNIANLAGGDSLGMPRTFARRPRVLQTIADQPRELVRCLGFRCLVTRWREPWRALSDRGPCALSRCLLVVLTRQPCASWNPCLSWNRPVFVDTMTNRVTASLAVQ